MQLQPKLQQKFLCNLTSCMKEGMTKKYAGELLAKRTVPSNAFQEEPKVYEEADILEKAGF